MGQVTYESKDRIGLITMNRPEKRNALNVEMIVALTEAFSRAATDDSIKVVILRATGSAFCAGMDLAYIAEMQQYSKEENLVDSNRLKNLFLQIHQMSKPVIAQVQGHALAGGCGLVTMCDFAFSVPDAGFGYTEVRIGFVPALVMVFLIAKIGEQRARELLLSGAIIEAEEARSYGLVYRCVKPQELESTVLTFAAKLVNNNSSESMQRVKTMINQIRDLPISEALTYAAEQNALARDTADCREGIQAFLHKKRQKW